MGTTPNGLPWPEGTAPVRDGDNAIKALAEKIDPRLPLGMTGVYGNYTVGAQGFCTVTFPRRVATATVTYVGSFAVVFTINAIAGNDVQVAVRQIADGSLVPNTTVTVAAVAQLFD
jgi:hypothetical protein